MSGQLALETKRINLSPVKGLEGAYLDCTPITFGDLQKLTGLQDIDEASAIIAMTDMLKSHVVSGKVFVYQDGKRVEAVAKPEHIDGLPMDGINLVFSQLTGEDLLDPKEQTTTEKTSQTTTIRVSEEPSN